MMNKVLVFTGFHRSATSATANFLHDAGLHMGENLMEGNISNIKGHFEDLPIVHLHDKQLRKAVTNWQFHDEVYLPQESDFLAEYIKRRDQQAIEQNKMQWGVKDPRICLYLDAWNEALLGKGRFLFIVRHWASCIESLLHRHSRELAFDLPPFSLDKPLGNLIFWNKSELSAKMWIAYNRRLLKFASTHRDKTIIVSQRALFEQANFDESPVIKLLNNKFEFELNVETKAPYQTDLFNDHANENIKRNLSFGLRQELDDVWHQLLELAELKSDNEQPNWYSPKQLPIKFLLNYQQQLKVRQINEINPYESEKIIAQVLREENCNNLLLLLERLLKVELDNKQSNDLIDRLSNDYSTNAEVQLALARISQKSQLHQKTILLLKQVQILGVYAPYMSMMIGQAYEALGDRTQAEYFLNKALKDNPNNPAFYNAKARFLETNNRSDDALQCLKEGMERLNYPIEVVIQHCNILIYKKEIQEAELILSNLEQNHPRLVSIRARLSLLKSAENYQDEYYQQKKNNIKDKDTLKWLANTSFLISDQNSEVDLIQRCLGHWDKISSCTS